MSTPDRKNTPTSLYRYYDSQGLLLYVGVTQQGYIRGLQHAQAPAPWWPSVSRQEVEHFATRAEALAAEVSAIETLRPLFNLAHSFKAQGLVDQDAYLHYRAFIQSPPSPNAVVVSSPERRTVWLYVPSAMVDFGHEFSPNVRNRMLHGEMRTYGEFAAVELVPVGAGRPEQVTHLARARKIRSKR